MRVIKFNTQMIIWGTVSALFLSACSDGSRTVITEKEIVMCDTNTTTILNKYDKVTAQTDDTEVRISHWQDSTKSVCVVTGRATVTLPTLR